MTIEELEVIDQALGQRYVRIHDVYFYLKSNYFQGEIISYHLVMSPKNDGLNECNIKLFGCFSTKEEGFEFLRDIEMLKIKYKLGSF